MSVFNQRSRTSNVLASSIVGAGCNIINSLMGFVYRSIFIRILSESYLGVNGLFSSILQILSITELGISTAITYRFYEPISKGDIQQVGRLLNFFKRVYLIIAGTILVLGLLLYPYLDFFIKDVSEVPSDINLNLVYLLYLIQTLSTYLFSYKLTILSADQKQYAVSITNTIITVLRYILQIITLSVWRNFTLALIANIITTILCNYFVSLWVTAKYKIVFQVHEKLSKSDQKLIFQDTKATMLHKIGGTVLFATDNIVLSKLVGLATVGLYSNYSLLISALSGIIDQLLSSFTSSIGNAHVELDKDASYTAYTRLLFVNLWLVGMVTSCVYILINDFIVFWVGEKMQMSMPVVAILCFQFYLQMCRKVTTSYTNACGLFVKDRVRPIVEAILNLIISVILATKFGISGVFIGTIISCLLTVFWREPYILYKYEFRKSTKEYWAIYTKFFVFSFLFNLICTNAMAVLGQNGSISIIAWLIKGIICILIYNVLFLLLFYKRKEFVFFRTLLIDKFIKRSV